MKRDYKNESTSNGYELASLMKAWNRVLFGDHSFKAVKSYYED